MNSQERVLVALRREQPDRVPWVEGGIDPPIQRALMGRDDFLPEELNDSSGPSPEASSGAGEHKTGDLVLIRRLLAGDWGEDFLVIEPGQESIMTYDEEIIGRRAVEGNGQQ